MTYEKWMDQRWMDELIKDGWMNRSKMWMNRSKMGGWMEDG